MARHDSDLSHPTSTPTPNRIPVIGRSFPAPNPPMSPDQARAPAPSIGKTNTPLCLPKAKTPASPPPQPLSNPPGMSGLSSLAQGVARTPPIKFRGTVTHDARRALHQISSISSTLSSVVPSDASVSAPLTISIEFNRAAAIDDIMGQVQGQIVGARHSISKADEDSLIEKWVTVCSHAHANRDNQRQHLSHTPPHAHLILA